MPVKTYAQDCGVARALDVLGERWTLLIVRELSLGPRRYRDLGEALPGVGTNLLAARLKALEAAGVLRKTTLPPPAGVSVYELTERGERLRPLLAELRAWGGELPVPEGDVTRRASWALLAMESAADAVQAAALGQLAEFRVDGEVVWARAGAEGTDVRVGAAPSKPTFTLTSDLPAFLALARGELAAADAVKAGTVELDGKRKQLARFFAVFRLQPDAAAGDSGENIVTR